MSFEVFCSNCYAELTAEDDMVGSHLECPSCSQLIVVSKGQTPGSVNRSSSNKPKTEEKLPAYVQIMAGWPLIMVVFGGLIGGGLGGAAYAINLQLYKSNLPGGLKVVLNVMTGLAAFILYVIIATALHSAIR